MLLTAAVLLLLICSGLTSMTEAAIFSVPMSRVHLALEQKRRGSRRLQAIKDKLGRPVAALVVLNNCVNIGGSILVGYLAKEEFGSFIAIFTAALTLAVIVFAEIIPKTVGERFSEHIALAAAPPLLVITKLLGPLIWAIERLTHPFSSKEIRIPSEEEIRALAHLGSEGGAISRHERDLIRRTFLLNDVSARDIMTHRLKLSTLPADRRLCDLSLAEIDLSHSRLLVTEDGDPDKIRGVALLRDILLARAERSERTVADVAMSVEFVYESLPADKLLERFKKTRQHLFVVVDEYGGTNGVVTLEDVLEELVGEIHDETDPAPDVATPPPSRTTGVETKDATGPRLTMRAAARESGVGYPPK